MDEYDETYDEDTDSRDYDTPDDFYASLTAEERAEMDAAPPDEKLPGQTEQAKNRLAKLRDRGMHVTPDEARERAALQEMVPLMEQRIAENEAAEAFRSVPDNEVALQAAEAEEAALEAQQARRQAKADLEALTNGLSTPMEQRVYESKVKRAGEVVMEAFETATRTRGEVERRQHIQEFGDMDHRVPWARQRERKLLQDLRTMVSPGAEPTAVLTPEGKVEGLRAATSEAVEGVSKQLSGEVTTDGRQESTG